MIPISTPNIGALEAEKLAECVTTKMVSTTGPFVNEFEAYLTKISGAAGAVSTSSGTSAIHAALHNVNVMHGELVIIPSLTFIATANAVAATGAEPWLFDSNSRDWTLNIAQVRNALLTETDPAPHGRMHRKSGKIVKAIVPVMIMGANPDFKGLQNLREEFGLSIIVDAAAAIGAVTELGPIGNVKVDAFCFSFNGNKTITCGGGGAILSNNKDQIAKLRHLTTTGRVGMDYDHDIVAFNYRMTNLNAAIGVAQLERLPEFLRTKTRVHEKYSTLAKEYDVLKTFPTGSDGHSTHWFSGVFYTGQDSTAPDRFRAHMRQANIDLRKFWKPVHLQQPYAHCLKATPQICSDLWERIFPLPCSTNITEHELEQTLDAAREFWSGEPK